MTTEAFVSYCRIEVTMSLQINIHPALSDESFESLAAAYDDATTRFSWYEYQGKPFQVSSRKHRREVNSGAVYGVRQVSVE
jgi:hypothetical protein